MGENGNIVDKWGKKKSEWMHVEAMQEGGRVGRQRTGNQRLKESHGKTKIRERRKERGK